MNSRVTPIKMVAGTCLIGLSSLVFAETAPALQALEKFKSASQELVRLQSGIKDAASAKAAQKKIDEATKRQQAAEANMTEAMKKLDPGNLQDAKLMERIYADMQAQNEAVANAQLKAIDVQSAAAEKAAAAKAAHQKQ